MAHSGRSPKAKKVLRQNRRTQEQKQRTEKSKRFQMDREHRGKGTSENPDHGCKEEGDFYLEVDI